MQLASSPLSAIDAASLEQLHHQYREQPDSLDESWRVLFQVLDEIDAKVDMKKLEETLMEEGLKKFADPQKALLALIASKRKALAPAGVG